MSEVVRILVDTNIWVDNYLPVREGSSVSRDFISLAKSQGCALVYPVHVLKDVFYNLGATLKRVQRMKNGDSAKPLEESDALAIQQIVWSCIDNMRLLATAVGADESDAWKACKYRSLSGDLEDNFVIVAAERARAHIMVTRDADLLRKSPVPAYTPEDAIAYLQSR